jgi:hypothetical protein
VIRPATLSDLESILDIAWAQAGRYPMLKRSKEKIRTIATSAISSAYHFCWVSFDLERGFTSPTGVLVGLSSENTWAERQSCHAMLWVADIPGDGARLLREFRDWIHSRRAIKVAGFAPDIDVDPRTWALVERIGFKRYGGAYLLYN